MARKPYTRSETAVLLVMCGVAGFVAGGTDRIWLAWSVAAVAVLAARLIVALMRRAHRPTSRISRTPGGS